jgi:hypothetical protein
MIIRKIRYLLALTFIFSGLLVVAQHVTTAEKAMEYAPILSTDRMERHLSILASDEYEGRETGEKGQRMAAEYIAAFFDSLTLTPAVGDTSFFQQVALQNLYPEGVTMKWNNRVFSFVDDFYYFRGFSDHQITADEIVFVGYGIEDEKYNDYQNMDVKDKVILILDGEPADKKGNFLISGTEDPSDWVMNWRTKLLHAAEKGAKAILVVDLNYQESIQSMKGRISAPSMMLTDSKIPDRILPNFFISKEMANVLLAEKKQQVDNLVKQITKSKKPSSFSLSGNFSLEMNRKRELFFSENVLGMIPGSENPDEYVVISGHYDHLGIRGEDIYNGADDNGSGTVAVMVMAEAFQRALKEGIKPKRSIVFALWTGEEKGLLGSLYYSENPLFPMSNTVSNLNIDMIGRIDDLYEEKDDKTYLYLIGSDRLSTRLHDISLEANAFFPELILDFTYNDPGDPNRLYYRSDHYNFAKHDVPSIFYFNGMHPDYHKTTDTVEKINFDLMALRSQYIFTVAWELTNRNERIAVDVK